MYFAYLLCAFLCEQATLWNSSEICFIFSFEINFRLVAVFKSAGDNKPTGARVAGLIHEEEPPLMPRLEDNEGRPRVPSANLALRLLSSDSSVTVWENFKTTSQLLV